MSEKKELPKLNIKLKDINGYITGSRAWSCHKEDSDYDVLILKSELTDKLKMKIDWRDSTEDEASYDIMCVCDGSFIDADGKQVHLMVYEQENLLKVMRYVTNAMEHVLSLDDLKDREKRITAFAGLTEIFYSIIIDQRVDEEHQNLKCSMFFTESQSDLPF